MANSQSVTFFIKHNDETRKVTAMKPVNVLEMFYKKFPESITIDGSNIVFELRDKDFGVFAKLEDPNEIYSGAVILARTMDSQPNGTDKRRIDHFSEEDSMTKKQKPEAVDYNMQHDSLHPFSEYPRFVVCCRGISWDNNEHDVRDFFQGLNIVENGIFLYSNDPLKEHHCGEAFVEFANEQDYQTALTYDRRMLNTRYIEVYPSSSEEMDKARDQVPKATIESKIEQLVPVSFQSHVIRLHGLPYQATENDVRQFLDGIDIVAIHFPKDQFDRPSGDAYVELPDENSVSEALPRDKRYIGSRFIDVRRSAIYELVNAMRRRTRAYDPYARSFPLRVRGLPYQCTDDDIINFFAPCDAAPVRVHRKVNGTEAYCEFPTIEMRDRALGRDRAYMGSRYLELFAVSYEDMANDIGITSPPPRDTYDYPPRHRRMADEDRFYRPRYDDYYRPRRMRPPYDEPPHYRVSCVHMLGLPYRVTSEEIHEFFKDHRMIEDSVKIGVDAFNKRDGTAIVDFASRADALRAVKDLNRKYIGQRYVELRVV